MIWYIWHKLLMNYHFLFLQCITLFTHTHVSSSRSNGLKVMLNGVLTHHARKPYNPSWLGSPHALQTWGDPNVRGSEAGRAGTTAGLLTCHHIIVLVSVAHEPSRTLHNSHKKSRATNKKNKFNVPRTYVALTSQWGTYQGLFSQNLIKRSSWFKLASHRTKVQNDVTASGPSIHFTQSTYLVGH